MRRSQQTTFMDTLTLHLTEYQKLLDTQQFVEADLDYTVFERLVPFLDQMASVKNSGITVFDLYKRQHLYASYNLEEIFGYNNQLVAQEGNAYFNSRVHPDDFVQLTQMSVSLMRFILALPAGERKNYKLQNEYRILNQHNRYTRIIEQHSLLETDVHDNLWLSLSVMDLSPNQTAGPGIQSQLINIRTGDICHYPTDHEPAIVPEATLTRRETEILQKVKEGLLSKEISDTLSLSVHTVNTHRQNILKKLGAGNSMEAVEMASNLGLV